MDILPIQGSSVPCERVFSSAKETMAPRRNRISTKMMEALQLLKYSLRYGRELNFTEGLDWDDELAEMESAHKAQLRTLEDLDSFIASIGLNNSDELESELDAELDIS